MGSHTAYYTVAAATVATVVVKRAHICMHILTQYAVRTHKNGDGVDNARTSRDIKLKQNRKTIE